MKTITLLFIAFLVKVVPYCVTYSKADGNTFSQMIQGHNAYILKNYARNPDIYVACTSTDSFQQWIATNRYYALTFKGGSHSAGGFSVRMDVNQPYAVLDTKYLKKVHIYTEGDSKIMRAGAGTHYMNLIKPLKKTKAFTVGGSCPSVGTTGFTAAGGYSFAHRTYGLAVDSLLQIEMVLLNGIVVLANKTHHKDLFFAFRGAGGILRVGQVEITPTA